VAFVLKRQGLRGAELKAQIAHWLDLAGLSAQADQPAASLSGGEAQRLAMVRALATRPDVLFLDEATAHLDPRATAAIEGLISLAATSGTMIVMVTHDRDQARRLSDQVIFLENGTVRETAPASEFFTKPQSPASKNYLAGYLSPTQMDIS
jgi:tungstate transport system ATP-binding protein